MDFFNLELNDKEINDISSLGLAHLGDCVYELLVRTMLCAHRHVTVGNLHRQTVSFVNAGAQALAAEKILPLLNEDELNVFKRGRNAKVNSVPKNSDMRTYHMATGLETLFGWLWLKNRKDRIEMLFSIITEEV